MSAADKKATLKQSLFDLAERALVWCVSPHGLRAWLRQRDLILHGSLLLVLALLYGFLQIADAVRNAEHTAIDQQLLLALREPGAPHDALGPEWFERAWGDVTALGSATVICVLAASTVGFLLLEGRKRVALAVIVATVGGGFLSLALKGFYQRPRPELALHLVQVTSASFPSGHSLAAAVLYPTLGAVAAQLVQKARLRSYLILVAAGLTLLVGMSRVYLGVHYPSDVLAGWCVGLSWAIVCWIVLRHVERRARRDNIQAPNS